MTKEILMILTMGLVLGTTGSAFASAALFCKAKGTCLPQEGPCEKIQTLELTGDRYELTISSMHKNSWPQTFTLTGHAVREESEGAPEQKMAHFALKDDQGVTINRVFVSSDGDHALLFEDAVFEKEKAIEMTCTGMPKHYTEDSEDCPARMELFYHSPWVGYYCAYFPY